MARLLNELTLLRALLTVVKAEVSESVSSLVGSSPASVIVISGCGKSCESDLPLWSEDTEEHVVLVWHFNTHFLWQHSAQLRHCTASFNQI